MKAVILMTCAGLLAGVVLAASPSERARVSTNEPFEKKKDTKRTSGISQEPSEKQARVQLAILLDTSGSMSGLIGQAKTQLWSIVNTFIAARQNGQVPFVEVALYEYGNNGLTKEAHWIRQIQPLTRDLDKISEELFALRTNGGEEYCGAVIQRAVSDLAWDASPDTYKAIFVAGNEPFTQGPVDPASSCREAIAKGVIVNTIHCGNEQAGIETGWKAGSLLADGRFLVINHNKALVHVDAPQDREIEEWNARLNKTYVPMGKVGKARLETQIAQDAEARLAKGNAIQQRVQTKASANYWNGNWDLVDACNAKGFDWNKLKKEDLPEEMREMTVDQRKAYIARKKEERSLCQKNIADLSKARSEFVRAKREELGQKSEDTLDAVVVETVREQAGNKGYTFKKD